VSPAPTGAVGPVVAAAAWALVACGGDPGPLGAATAVVIEAGLPDAADAGADAADEAAPPPGPDDECAGDGLIPDSTGFVSADTNASGIQGAWHVYRDCDDYALLEAGTAYPGKNCSDVMSPAPGAPFAPQPGSAEMCSSGSTVQVLHDDEWPLRWGTYLALDLANGSGTFDATAAGVRGFCFYVMGSTVPAFRVRFSTDPPIADRNWYQTTLLHEGWHRVLFSDLAQVAPTGVPFDPTRIVSLEIEIPGSRAEAVPWDFCIDGLTALR
jgi:hypothetical protein